LQIFLLNAFNFKYIQIRNIYNAKIESFFMFKKTYNSLNGIFRV